MLTLDRFHQGANQFLDLIRIERGKLADTKKEANEHLNKITQVEKKIRDGIVAFFEGNYDQSIEQLTDAARDFDSNVNIYAFLGCAYAAKYLLLGEEDKELYESAINKFNKVKELDPNYQLDERYISPTIIKIFSGR